MVPRPKSLPGGCQRAGDSQVPLSGSAVMKTLLGSKLYQGEITRDATRICGSPPRNTGEGDRRTNHSSEVAS